MAKSRVKRIILIVLLVMLLLGGLIAFVSLVSNPWNARTLGDIATPVGYTRVDTGDAAYNEYLRNLPLKKRGAKVYLYDGNLARLQFLSAAVIDIPIISRDEQCADVTMRLRAEYLWSKHRYSDIRFRSVGGNTLQYEGGGSRSSFERYLKKVYGACNTTSVFDETSVRKLEDIRPGDVLVFKSRHKGRYGHAILVADVARNKKGKVAVLCIEGNTPARNAHVVRNLNPLSNPWHYLRPEGDYWISVFNFHQNELRHY